MPISLKSSQIETQRQIGSFIAELREKRGLSQQQLAKALKTSQSAVARMEAGEQNFTTEMLSKISHALNQEIMTIATPSKAMNYQIEGGHKLSGTATTKVSKNSAMVLLCAALLNKNKTILKQMPRIAEVDRMVEALSSIGIATKWLPGNDLEIIPPAKIQWNKLNQKSAVATRSMLMLLGPLVHHFKEFMLPHPGGCKLGKRTVRPHFFALEKLGVNIITKRGIHIVKVGKLAPAEIVLYESGDTVTENALMAAALIPGKTVIKYASANYQVQDLCHYLIKLGVGIQGIGTTTLTVHGVAEINTPITFYPTEDPIEAMLFLSIAATTNSSLKIERCPIDFLELELLKLEKMGFKYKTIKKYKSKNGFANLVDIETYPSKFVALEEKIYGRPYPGLNIDNLPFFVPVATQAKGTTLIHDWAYENRAIYYLELTKLGATVLLADPHRVYIEGPTELKGADVICPPALRPAVIILIAMLAAKGTSTLRNVYSISRGYEDLCNRLSQLGAKIKVI